MLRLTTPLALALLLAACASTAPVPPAPGQASGYFSVRAAGYDKLDRLGSAVWVELEEEAYVAVFNIIRDQGAALVWPYSTSSPRTLPGGRSQLPALTAEEEHIATWRRSHLLPGFDETTSSPGLMLVVASSQPLELAAVLEDHAALARQLGGASTDPALATSKILELFVQNPQGHNWGWTCLGEPLWCRGR